jgi:hypothetical protein
MARRGISGFVGLRSWSRLQERLESSDLGRTVISAFVVVVLVAIVAENLPASNLQRELAEVSRPLVRALNLSQVWGVFAPDPRRRSVSLSARITLDDGTVLTWRPPDGLPFPHSYRDVHWRRWADAISRDDLQRAIAGPTAEWLARRHASPRRVPTRVEIVVGTRDLHPPGEEPDREPWQETVVHTLEVTPALLAENRG